IESVKKNAPDAEIVKE
ncbi:MAG: DUF1508 domain-containing protein, partial [Clostridia bacterium]|nr:DUF1508 domain-containing protein [Clostridia bacterium]